MAVCLEYQAVYCDRRSSRTSVRVQLAAALVLLCALLFRVWIKVESTDIGYQLAREQQRTIELDMQRRELELQHSVLVRPDSLYKMAHERLGLQMLVSSQARKVSGGIR